MIGPAEVFTFFFVALGPLKILTPFAVRTRDLDDAHVRQLALWVFTVATLSAALGGLLGSALLFTWGISLPAMLLTGGLVFFLVALRQLLAQYDPQPAGAPEPLPRHPLAAAARLAAPMVVTPYGTAAVIVLLAASEDNRRTAMILALLLVVMLSNLVAMWFARRILAGPSALGLQVLGSVLAVLQVALSIQMIFAGLSELGLPGMARHVRP